MSALPKPTLAKPGRAAPVVATRLAARPPAALDLQTMLSYYLLRDLEQAVDRTELALSEPDAQPLDPQAAAQRRQLARQLVIGAWLNRNNPGWDPRVPESHAPDPNDPMVAVLAAVANGAAEPLTTAPENAESAASRPARCATGEPTWP
jgi:hypothetical protein